MITEEMIREGYEAGIVRLIDSPHGGGAVCQIGESWFYFWDWASNAGDSCDDSYDDGFDDNSEEPPELTVADLTSRYPADVIIHEIWVGLERAKHELEFSDEYDYYEAVLMEGLRN